MDLYFIALVVPAPGPVWINQVLSLAQLAQLLEMNCKALRRRVLGSGTLMAQGYTFQILGEWESKNSLETPW